MSAIKEAIKNSTRMTRMRLGQQAFEWLELPSLKGLDGVTPVRVAQVPLTEAEVQQGLMAAAMLEIPDNMAGYTARNRASQTSDVWLSMREPDNLTELVFGSVDEMCDTLEPTDIDLAVDSLAVMMDYASPALDGLDEKAVEDLKKDFAAMDWSELSGRRWAAVKLCCQILVPELLQAKLSGFSSTASLTTTSDESESTQLVDPN